MQKNRLIRGAGIVGALALATGILGCGQSTSSPANGSGEAGGQAVGTVSIALSTWTGFAPLYVAEEKGFFDTEGVHVNLVKMESVADRRSALAANRIQGFTTTIDSHVVTAASGVPVVQVLAVDDSYGGDGVVAKKEIQSLADLRGKTVAVQTDGGASYFWFLYLLKQNHIDKNEIKFESMTAGDAGAAFVAKKVDAAVTWEPWLSRAEKTDFGHVLIKSDKTPGVITDTLGFRKDFVDAHPDAVKKVVRAWFDALDYIHKNPDDAYAIMAKNLGQSLDDFKSSVHEVRWYDQALNKQYFGNPVSDGQLYKLTEMAADFWVEQGIIKQKPNISELVDGRFVE
ncbi:MAG: ABC transporter substrate-binding protein [Kyrpidia tusciae]|nr:ABC transporter substrate-binding protein [Kyrpidia tusciae]MBE3552630.1 ABC transporter substrate-binding protein [Kyrpidia tusciae]